MSLVCKNDIVSCCARVLVVKDIHNERKRYIKCTSYHLTIAMLLQYVAYLMCKDKGTKRQIDLHKMQIIYHKAFSQ